MSKPADTDGFRNTNGVVENSAPVVNVTDVPGPHATVAADPDERTTVASDGTWARKVAAVLLPATWRMETATAHHLTG
jgi:hypothetical protein